MKNKIIVIGCPGAGKSTFSRKLADKTGLPLYHLDAIYWKEDCSHISRRRLIAEQKKILNGDSYIIDGNFKSTLEMRVKEAETVFLFDLPTEDCIYGVTHREGNRPEMPCELPCNDELIDFVRSFNTDVKPTIDNLLKKYSKDVIVFHSRKEVDLYLSQIKNDLTLKTNEGYFNYRVAAVIVNNGRLLAQKNMDDNSYYLVGGRVAFGETSDEALIRELNEELNINVKDYSPVWINECFFIDKIKNGEDRKFHEIGIYYLVDISDTNFTHYENEFEIDEQDRKNIYCWLEIGRLNNIVLNPQFIKNEIKSIDKGLKLIITREADYDE